MAKPILVANWKNYPSSQEEARTILSALSRKSTLYKKLSLFIAPPLPYLDLVSTRAKSFSRLASQDLPTLAKGTFTGEVMPDILKSFGVRVAILGHSERRALGETSEIVAQKVKVALRAGIVPVVCVGEESRDQEGEHFDFLRQQIKHSLSGLSKQAVSSLIVAYEPVWAIGKNAKEAIGPVDLAESVIFIRKVLSDLFGRNVAESVPVLYGGSVDAKNSEALAQTSGLRGFLVGRASLNPKSFEAVASSLL